MSDNTQRSDELPNSASEIDCYCPAGGVIEVLSRRHAMPVICAVGALEPVRYAGIEDALGDVSSSTLSTRLEELTDKGLLARERYAEIPPRVEYELTDEGAELCERLEPVLEWVEKQESTEA